MAVEKNIKIGETIHWDIPTHNESGISENADTPPEFYIFDQASDTPIHRDKYTLRTWDYGAGLYRATMNLSGSLFTEGHYYTVATSGTVNLRNGLEAWGFHVPSGEVTPSTPAAIADAVWDETVTGHVANDTFGSGLGAAMLPIFYADIRYTYDKNAASQDEYTVAWFRNAIQLSSGDISSNVYIQGYKRSDGTNLFATTTMGAASTTLGLFTHSESAGRLVPGEAAMIEVSGTIQGANRVWSKIITRDSGVLS